MKRTFRTLLLSLLAPALLSAAAYAATPAAVFPAPSTDEAGVTQWGYLDDEGGQVTSFIYTTASEFDDTGLAVVTNAAGQVSLIGQNGKRLTGWLDPPENISSDGVYKALDYGGFIDYYDNTGHLAGSIEGAVGFPGDGLVVTVDPDGLYGYTALLPDQIPEPEGAETGEGTSETDETVETPAEPSDKDGEPAEEAPPPDNDPYAIAPQYQAAGAFRKGRALVQLNGGSYAVINTRGQVLKQLPEGAAPKSLDIYADTAVILEMQGKYALYSLDTMQFATSFSYDDILPFDRNAARCRVDNLWGLLTPSGSVVLEPQYPYLSYMGEGVYAARGTDPGAAAVGETGGILYTTDTYVGGFQTFSHGLSWHGDLAGNVVFFNARGTAAKPMQGVDNPQVLTSTVARVTRDDADCYVDIYSGETLYSNTRSYDLPGGLRITSEVYEKYLGLRADGTEYGYHVEYPQLSGLGDEAVQAVINDTIRSFFVSGPYGTQDRSLDATFGFSVEGDVLVVWANGVSGLDLSAVVWNDSIGLDLRTGAAYTVYDSLLPGSMLPALTKLVPGDPPYLESPRMDADGITFFRSYPAKNGAEPYAESVWLSYEELASVIDFDSACYRALSGFQGVIFSDVGYGHWAFDAIAEVARQGWMKGNTDGRFLPNGEMTMAEAVATVGRMLGLTGGVMPMVEPSAWYAGEAGGLYEAGLLEGFQEPWLLLPQPMPREDAMQLIANALLRQGAQPAGDGAGLLAGFPDSPQLSPSRRAAAALCVQEGIVSGGGGGLRPGDVFTRAEFAQILQNFAVFAAKT